MQRALSIARIVGALCFAALCMASALTVLQMREIAVSEANNLDKLAQRAVAAEQDVDDTVNDLHTRLRQTLVQINRPCKGAGGPQACGTLAEANVLLRRGSDILETTQWNEDKEATLLNEDLPALITGSQKTLSAYQKTGEALTAATQRLQPVEDNAALDLAQLDTLLADPDIKTTLTNSAAATDSIASTAKHLDGTAADTQQAVHSFLHPGWKTKAANWAGKIVHALGGWF